MKAAHDGPSDGTMGRIVGSVLTGGFCSLCSLCSFLVACAAVSLQSGDGITRVSGS